MFGHVKSIKLIYIYGYYIVIYTRTSLMVVYKYQSYMIVVLSPFVLVLSRFIPMVHTPFKGLRRQDGFWEVSVQAVRLGNRTLDSCESGCRGIIDTGASRSYGGCGMVWWANASFMRIFYMNNHEKNNVSLMIFKLHEGDSTTKWVIFMGKL